jgi:hypothetical protein
MKCGQIKCELLPSVPEKTLGRVMARHPHKAETVCFAGTDNAENKVFLFHGTS